MDQSYLEKVQFNQTVIICELQFLHYNLVYSNLNFQVERSVTLVSSIAVERRRCALQVSSVARLQQSRET